MILLPAFMSAVQLLQQQGHTQGAALLGNHLGQPVIAPQFLSFPVSSQAWCHGVPSSRRGGVRFCRGLGCTGALGEDKRRRESWAGPQASFRVAWRVVGAGLGKLGGLWKLYAGTWPAVITPESQLQWGSENVRGGCDWLSAEAQNNCI